MCFHSKCYFLISWDPYFNIRINAVFVTHVVFNGKISSFFPFLSPSDWKCRTIWNTTQGFQSGLVPGTFTHLRSCIVPAEITEPPKISGGQNHKYSTERDIPWSITVIVVMSRRVMGIQILNSCRWSGGNKTPGVNLVIVLQVKLVG